MKIDGLGVRCRHSLVLHPQSFFCLSCTVVLSVHDVGAWVGACAHGFPSHTFCIEFDNIRIAYTWYVDCTTKWKWKADKHTTQFIRTDKRRHNWRKSWYVDGDNIVWSRIACAFFPIFLFRSFSTFRMVAALLVVVVVMTIAPLTAAAAEEECLYVLFGSAFKTFFNAVELLFYYRFSYWYPSRNSKFKCIVCSALTPTHSPNWIWYAEFSPLFRCCWYGFSCFHLNFIAIVCGVRGIAVAVAATAAAAVFVNGFPFDKVSPSL